MASTKYKLRKEDLVQVIAGKDKGKQGKVLKIDRENGRVIVAGVNMVKKAMKKKDLDYLEFQVYCLYSTMMF